MTAKIFIFDTTLRDGAQQEGINLSVADKLTLLPILEQMGADYIEGGWPGAIPRDTEFFSKLKTARAEGRDYLQRAKLVAFGATRKAHLEVAEDAQVQALLAADAPIVCLVAKSDYRHVEQALRTTGAENLAMVRDTVTYLREQGREVMVDLEHFFDGYEFDASYTVSVAREALAAGASWVILCDTNGGTLPSRVAKIVQELKQELAVAGYPDAQLGIHAHDDSGCAVANSIAAVEAGCRQVQGTVNGYGERTGNANLTTLVPNLALKTDFEVVTEAQLAEYHDCAHAVAEITNISPAPRQPYVGASAFAHKAGLHASAIRVNADLYQHIDPLLVGNDMRMIVSDMAGRASIELKAREFGIDLAGNPDALSEITNRVKAAEAAGYTYDAADASLELLTREIVFGSRPNYFTVESWAADVSLQKGEGSSEARVKIHAGGRRLMRIGEGVGPVDALDRALRTALKNVYPTLTEFVLTDFKVRILNPGAATAATTRVLITISDGKRTWTTVGVGMDVIEASWEALTDGYIFGLFQSQIPEQGPSLPE
ncbi:MAG: citramalate synthase [Arcanobacterium sp.]|nr:citramalate synthase [Arcanobacterium sp.]